MAMSLKGLHQMVSDKACPSRDEDFQRNSHAPELLTVRRRSQREAVHGAVQRDRMNLVRQVFTAVHAHTDVVRRESGEETLLVSGLEQDVNGAADVALIKIETFRSGQAAQDCAASLDRLGGYSIRKFD